MIVAVVWLERKPLTGKEIANSLQSNFGISVDFATIESQMSALCSEQILIQISSNEPKLQKVKVSEEHLRRFESELKSSINEGNQAKTQFLKLINGCCANLEGENVWEDFNNNFLLPMIKDVGANAYKLVSGESRIEDNSYLNKFIEKYDDLNKTGLRRALIEFLNPKNSFTRSYILSNLNVYFLVEAAGIPSKTLAAIERSQKGKPKFRLFLDTNTLFSILGLHENPSDAAAVTLINLASSVKEKIELKLYVLPETVEETRRVIAAAAHYLDNVGVPKNVALALPNFKSSGILMKYLDEAKRSPERIQPKDYFAPYINDLKTMLHSKGIEVYGAPISHMHQRQDVVDDTLSQLQHEEVKPIPKRKNYEAIQHDVTLWHVVNDARPPVLETPLDAGDWVVTLDYSLLGFDRFKQKSKGGGVPVCILPVSLSQLLQFWAPRTQDMEESILSSIQLPLLFHEFSVEDEKTTLKIVQVISRYQNAEDIPVEIVQAILVNGALRSRIAENVTDEEQMALVRDALIDQHVEVKSNLDKTNKLVSQLKEESILKHGTIANLTSEGDRYREQLLVKEIEIEKSKNEALIHSKNFNDYQELMRFKEFVIYMPTILVILLVASFYYFFSHENNRYIWYMLIAISIFLIGWVEWAKYYGQGKQLVESSSLFEMTKKFSKLIFWIVLVVISWAISKVLDPYWDAISKFFSS